MVIEFQKTCNIVNISLAAFEILYLAFGLVVIENDRLDIDGKQKKYFVYNLLTTARAGIAQSL
jgi:hypothetical protein